MGLFSFLTKEVAIDLGTANTIIIYNDKVVVDEPSIVAIERHTGRIIAVGKKAMMMHGKTHENIKTIRPLRDGVIADFRVTQAMLRYFIHKSSGPFQFLKPELMIAVPAGITSTERRAVIEAATNAGAREAFVAKEPILAAIGASIPINACSGHLIVDIGGGTSEVAVISLGGIVTSGSVRVAGDKMNVAISEYIKKKHNLAVGDQTAEDIKIKIGTALPEKEEKTMEIRGRDLLSGLPRTIKISSNEVAGAITDTLTEIIQVIKQVLRDTPPELSADVMDKGMVLSGGGALLRNMDELIAQSTGVPCFMAEEPLLCVAKGTGVVLENLDIYKKSIMSKRK